MDENSIPVWLLPLLSFIVGVAVAMLVTRMMRNGPSDSTESRLDDLQERFNSYQDEVVAHFSTTAELVNKLTENYQNVQEHLLQSAERLALDEDTRQRLLNSLVDHKALERPQAEAPAEAPEAPVAQEQQEPAESEAPAAAPAAEEAEPEVIPEPPRDYASKKEGEVGTLDESFGHKKD